MPIVLLSCIRLHSFNVHNVANTFVLGRRVFKILPYTTFTFWPRQLSEHNYFVSCFVFQEIIIFWLSAYVLRNYTNIFNLFSISVPEKII